MGRVLRRAVTGTPAICAAGSVAVLGFSALAWGLWGANGGVGSMGLMSIEPSSTVTAPPVEATPVTAPPVAPPVVDEPAEMTQDEVHAEDTASHDGPTFDGRPLRPVEQMDMRVTAYSPDEQSCGEWADGWTASGYSVWTNGMKLVAADTSILPFGTLVSIPGYNNGEPVEVLDVGGAIKGNRLDVLYPTHERALQWGVQDLEVTVWEYAD